MTMASLDLKWCFKNDFVEIKGVKIPLSVSGKKKELLEIKGNGEKPELVELPHLNRAETENLYPCHEMEIPPNHEMNILLKMRHKHNETKKGKLRDFIIFPNLKMLKRKGLISNTNAICSKNEFILKFFNPFSTGVKLQKQDVLAFALEADNKFQSYLDKVLVKKIRRNVEKDEKTRKNEEILNILSLAEEQMSNGGQIC